MMARKLAIAVESASRLPLTNTSHVPRCSWATRTRQALGRHVLSSRDRADGTNDTV